MDAIINNYDIFHIVLLHLPTHILYFISSSPYQEDCYAHLYKNVRIAYRGSCLGIESYGNLYSDLYTDPRTNSYTDKLGKYTKFFRGVEPFLRFYRTTPTYFPNELTFTDQEVLQALYIKAPKLCRRCKIHLDYWQAERFPLWMYDLRFGTIKSKILPCPEADHLKLWGIKCTITEIPLVASLEIEECPFDNRILDSPRLTRLRVRSVKSVSLGRKNYLSSLIIESARSIDVSQCRSLTRVSLCLDIKSYAFPSYLERLTLGTSILTDLRFLTKLRYLKLMVGYKYQGTLVLPAHLEELIIRGDSSCHFLPEAPFSIPDVRDLSLIRMCLEGFEIPISVVRLNFMDSLGYNTDFSRYPNLKELKLHESSSAVIFPPVLDYLNVVIPTTSTYPRVKTLALGYSYDMSYKYSLETNSLKSSSNIVHLSIHAFVIHGFDFCSETLTSLSLRGSLTSSLLDLSEVPNLTELSLHFMFYVELVQLPPKLRYLLLFGVCVNDMKFPPELRYIRLVRVKYNSLSFGDQLENIHFSHIELSLLELPPTVRKAYFMDCDFENFQADFSNTRMYSLYIEGDRAFKIKELELPSCLEEFIIDGLFVTRNKSSCSTRGIQFHKPYAARCDYKKLERFQQSLKGKWYCDSSVTKGMTIVYP